jgi:hypothetical protein
MNPEDVNPAADKSLLAARAVPVLRSEHTESLVTRMIEQQTAKVPSDIFLAASLGAACASLVLELAGKERPARFIGMWVSPLLVMGVYNKLVKVTGLS